MDSAPLQSAGFDEAVRSTEAGQALPVKAAMHDHGGLLNIPIQRFWDEADAGSAGLNPAEFTVLLLHTGVRLNYGLAAGSMASPAQMEAFWRGLRLRELALAHGCALGRDAAWARFIQEYRGPLTQAAIAITRSASLGEDLADSLYSELYGLTERDGERRSPFASYSGRGSLMGWLRTTLAQRHVDHHRRTRREAPLENEDFMRDEAEPTPSRQTLAHLKTALAAAMKGLEPEARFVLASWFLDGRTLLQIARTLHVSEATVSRQVKRLTEKLHQEVLKHLQAGGLSKRAAEEALGTDPRDMDINLRDLLQTSQAAAFLTQESRTGQGQS